MTLRIRLIVAFLLMSVVPLAAVTGFSYVSTRNAFRQSAEIKSDLMAEELSRRMEAVTGDIERRLGRIWRMSRPGGPAPPGGPEGPEGPAGPGWPAMPNPDDVARALGNFAALVEKLELVPGETGRALAAAASDAAGTATPPGGSAAAAGDPARSGSGAAGRLAPGVPTLARGAGTAPRSPSSPPATPGGTPSSAAVGGVIVVEMPKPAEQADPARMKAEFQAAVIEAQQTARQEAQAGGRGPGSQPGRPPGGGPWSDDRRPGRDFDFRVLEDGQRVGTVHARVNLERMLRSILFMTRRDQGEIPFAVDADDVVHTAEPEDGTRLASLDLAARARAQHTGRSANGDWVIVTREVPSGVVFGIARPIGGSLAELRRASARNLGLGLAFILLALAGIVPLSNRMTRNLTTLTAGVERIAGGDLTSRVEVRSRDEFGRLAETVNRMARDLSEHERLVVEQVRLRRELELSRQIQTEMLPRGTLRLGLAEVKGVSVPCREVGGDFFNYFALPSGELALLVGDVSGKGISAALLMANIQATLRARLPLEGGLADLVDAIDHDVHDNTPPEVYLTLFIGVLDRSGRTLRYVNAGHNPQFVLRADGSLAQMPATGLPVGLLPGRGYEQQSIDVGDSDLLFFYTDGTVDIANESGEFFGYEQLAEVITRNRALGVEEILVEVEAELRRFRGAVEPADDATMMALRLAPGAAGTAQATPESAPPA